MEFLNSVVQNATLSLEIWKQFNSETTPIKELCQTGVKNYYLIGRQTMKITTTYSGKMNSFSPRLDTNEVLKKTKKD